MGLPVTLSWGGLSPSYCWVSWNKLGADIVSKITATLAGSFNGFFVGPTQPADKTLVWIRTDNTSPNWQIEGVYLWDAANAPDGWTPQQDPCKILYGNDAGIVNALAVNYAFDVPHVAGIANRFTLSAGLFIITKAAVTNTGAATLNVNGLGATAIQKMTDFGLTDVIAGEIKAGGIYEFVYDGTRFIILNPTATTTFEMIAPTAIVNYAVLDQAWTTYDLTSLAGVPSSAKFVLLNMYGLGVQGPAANADQWKIQVRENSLSSVYDTLFLQAGNAAGTSLSFPGSASFWCPVNIVDVGGGVLHAQIDIQLSHYNSVNATSFTGSVTAVGYFS